MIKTYIEYSFPGSFFSEHSVKEVANRNIPKSVPDGCFGFCFFDVEEVDVNGERLTGKRKNKSGMHYYGEKLNANQVAKLPDTAILLRNMKNNNWDFVVRTIRGNFQPLHADDVII